MAEIKYWIEATRPKTLPAGATPVGIAGAAAFHDGVFSFWVCALALICSLLIQIITNFINEIYDAKKGADTEERVGPRRAVAEGIINPREMRNVTIVLIMITFVLGLLLVFEGGWPILAIGLFSFLFAWLYTGGPYPLAYLGISDIFVLIFFGITAVCGTYYIQAQTLPLEIFLISLAPGFLSMNILGVNNMRDIETDVKAGKITLAVRLGRKNANRLYLALNIAAFAVPVVIAFLAGNFWMLISLAAFPLSVKITRDVLKSSGPAMNKLLAGTGKLLIIHSLLIMTGYIIDAVV